MNNNQNFQAWFGNSKVVDEDGNPLKVYHATTNSFKTFSAKKTSEDNYVGKGLYFTNSIDEVNDSYVGKSHQDYEQRKEYFVNQFIGNPKNLPVLKRLCALNGWSDDSTEDCLNDPHGTDQDIKDFVWDWIEENIQHKGAIMPSYLRIEKPFYLHFKDYDFVTQVPVGARLHNLVRNNVEKLWNTRFLGKLSDYYGDYITGDQLFELYHDQGYTMDYENTGFLQFVQMLGYDGIIMDASENFNYLKGQYGINHYIVPKSTQIKSVFNKGTWSRNKKRTNESVERLTEARAVYDYYQQWFYGKETFDGLIKFLDNPKYETWVVDALVQFSKKQGWSKIEDDYLTSSSLIKRVKEDLDIWDKFTNNDKYLKAGIITSKDLNKAINDLKAVYPEEPDWFFFSKNLPDRFNYLFLLIKTTIKKNLETSEFPGITVSDDEYKILFRTEDWIGVQVFTVQASFEWGRKTVPNGLGSTCVSYENGSYFNNDGYMSAYSQKQFNARLMYIRHLPFDATGLCAFYTEKPQENQVEISDLRNNHDDYDYSVIPKKESYPEKVTKFVYKFVGVNEEHVSLKEEFLETMDIGVLSPLDPVRDNILLKKIEKELSKKPANAHTLVGMVSFSTVIIPNISTIAMHLVYFVTNSSSVKANNQLAILFKNFSNNPVFQEGVIESLPKLSEDMGFYETSLLFLIENIMKCPLSDTLQQKLGNTIMLTIQTESGEIPTEFINILLRNAQTLMLPMETHVFKQMSLPNMNLLLTSGLLDEQFKIWKKDFEVEVGGKKTRLESYSIVYPERFSQEKYKALAEFLGADLENPEPTRFAISLLDSMNNKLELVLTNILTNAEEPRNKKIISLLIAELRKGGYAENIQYHLSDMLADNSTKDLILNTPGLIFDALKHGSIRSLLDKPEGRLGLVRMIDMTLEFHKVVMPDSVDRSISRGEVLSTIMQSNFISVYSRTIPHFGIGEIDDPLFQKILSLYSTPEDSGALLTYFADLALKDIKAYPEGEKKSDCVKDLLAFAKKYRKYIIKMGAWGKLVNYFGEDALESKDVYERIMSKRNNFLKENKLDPEYGMAPYSGGELLQDDEAEEEFQENNLYKLGVLS